MYSSRRSGLANNNIHRCTEEASELFWFVAVRQPDSQKKKRILSRIYYYDYFGFSFIFILFWTKEKRNVHSMNWPGLC